MDKLKKEYELIIVGSGPAGLTASIYASRFRVDNLVIGEALGGLAFEAHKICNYPSEKEISGVDLVLKMQENVESLGAKILSDRVVGIGKTEEGRFKILTQGKKELLARTVLIASGTKHRKLGLAGEEKYIGRGISYCATCDAAFYKDKRVVVVGGSNSAHTAALYLAEMAERVYQVYRGDSLRGETVWIEQVLSNPKIEVLFETEIKGLIGEGKLEKVVLSKDYQGQNELGVDGLFVEIGTMPDQELSGQLDLEVNEAGYIKVGADQKTSQPGVWAAGDITDGSNNLRQIITAASEGSIAAEDIFKSLKAAKV